MSEGLSELKRAKIDIATAASHAIVAPVAGKTIVVISCFFITAGAVTVTFEDDDGTDLTGAMSFPANGGMALADADGGWIRTNHGEGLNMLLGGAVQVSGSLTYREAPTEFKF